MERFFVQFFKSKIGNVMRATVLQSVESDALFWFKKLLFASHRLGFSL